MVLLVCEMVMIWAQLVAADLTKRPVAVDRVLIFALAEVMEALLAARLAAFLTSLLVVTVVVLVVVEVVVEVEVVVVVVVTVVVVDVDFVVVVEVIPLLQYLGELILPSIHFL